MEKSNFQAVIFGIIFVTINVHTSKLFKSILNDVQTKGKGEIIWLNISTLKMYFDTISVEVQKSKFFGGF